ncbi:MAG: MFS transporter, partial [Novosphingobium sp.]
MATALSQSCDAGAARSAVGRATANPNWTIAATMLASSLAFIDGSVTNVALPAIGKDLGGSASDLSWAINAYLLPLSALLLIGGALGDHYGRRRVLIVGVALFTLASIGCALAPSLAALLASRGLQGIGAALLLPNSLGILGSAFAGQARGRAVGTWAAAGAIASAVGPPLGGWLIDAVGWRSIFYLNVPVALGAVFIFLRYVAETERSEGTLDWRGAALATGGLGLLTWALTSWSTRHEVSALVGTTIAAGGALLVLFVLNERHLRDRAMMPLALFASKAFVGLTVLTFLLYGALGGLLMLLPYLLIVGGGYTPTEAGLALLPFSI